MSLRKMINVYTNNDNIVIANTNIIRLGPAGLIGTSAPFNIVKAGVFSLSFVIADCNCWLSWLYVLYFNCISFSKSSCFDRKLSKTTSVLASA